MSMSTRRLCRRLHYWFGAAIAVPFFLIALSGCLLDYSREIDKALNPDLYRASGPDHIASAQQVLETARADNPTPVMTIQVPGGDLPVWIVAQGNGQGTGMGIQQEIFIDPQSGAVIGKRATYPTLIRFLHRLHDALLIDDGGRTLVGYLGLLLAGLIVTGLVVWLPPPQGWRRSFLPRRGTQGNRWLLNWHTAAFAWTLPLILLVTVTGITMEFPQSTRATLGLPQSNGMQMMGMAGPVLPPETPYPVTVDQALAAAQAALPSYELVNFSPAGRDRGMYRVSLRATEGLWLGRRQVMVDARTGAIHAHNPPQGFATFYVAEQHGLHGGGSFGFWGRTVICLCGAAQVWLAISGFLVWLRRQRSRFVSIPLPQTQEN